MLKKYPFLTHSARWGWLSLWRTGASMKGFQQDTKTWWLSGVNLLTTADRAAGLEPVCFLSLVWLSKAGAGTDQLHSHWSPSSSPRPAALQLTSRQLKDCYCSFSKPGKRKTFCLGQQNQAGQAKPNWTAPQSAWAVRLHSFFTLKFLPKSPRILPPWPHTHLGPGLEIQQPLLGIKRRGSWNRHIHKSLQDNYSHSACTKPTKSGAGISKIFTLFRTSLQWHQTLNTGQSLQKPKAEHCWNFPLSSPRLKIFYHSTSLSFTFRNYFQPNNEVHKNKLRHKEIAYK